MDRVREREVANALRRLAHLSDADRAAVEHLSRAVMNKFLHAPSVRLRAAASDPDANGVVDAARYLFALDDAQQRAERQLRLVDDAAPDPSLPDDGQR